VVEVSDWGIRRRVVICVDQDEVRGRRETEGTSLGANRDVVGGEMNARRGESRMVVVVRGLARVDG
jgi:hypothetical protein